MWEYRAAVVRTIDGDTLVLLVDTGFWGRQEEHLRLVDVSAPELREPGGLEAKRFTEQWVAAGAGGRWPLLVRTVLNTNPEPDERRTLTRYLGHVHDHGWPNDPAARHLNADLRGWLQQHPDWGPGL